MKLCAWGQSDPGRKRERNEDSYLIDTEIGMLVIADGMGGHQGGAIASRMAIECFAAELLASRATCAGLPELMRRAAQRASGIIYEFACTRRELVGMGTTFTSLVIERGEAYILHAGDSRCYIVRNGSLRQITEDHSWIAEQLRVDIITAERAKRSNRRHLVTKSIGFQRTTDPDLSRMPMSSGDVFLLCSDGLTNHVANDELERIVMEVDHRNLPETLIALANDRGGYDNITVLVGRIETLALDSRSQQQT